MSPTAALCLRPPPPDRPTRGLPNPYRWLRVSRQLDRPLPDFRLACEPGLIVVNDAQISSAVCRHDRQSELCQVNTMPSIGTNPESAGKGRAENVPPRFWQKPISAGHRHLCPYTAQCAGAKWFGQT